MAITNVTPSRTSMSRTAKYINDLMHSLGYEGKEVVDKYFYGYFVKELPKEFKRVVAYIQNPSSWVEVEFYDKDKVVTDVMRVDLKAGENVRSVLNFCERVEIVT